jgi:hypothetical protein
MKKLFYLFILISLSAVCMRKVGGRFWILIKTGRLTWATYPTAKTLILMMPAGEN